MVTTDMLALREAAMAGVGVVQLPLLMVRDQLASGVRGVKYTSALAPSGPVSCHLC
jgi:DNA-binding transcriptional LysR family regulator